jgi:hypothetical protein
MERSNVLVNGKLGRTLVVKNMFKCEKCGARKRETCTCENTIIRDLLSGELSFDDYLSTK